MRKTYYLFTLILVLPMITFVEWDKYFDDPQMIAFNIIYVLIGTYLIEYSFHFMYRYKTLNDPYYIEGVKRVADLVDGMIIGNSFEDVCAYRNNVVDQRTRRYYLILFMEYYKEYEVRTDRFLNKSFLDVLFDRKLPIKVRFDLMKERITYKPYDTKYVLLEWTNNNNKPSAYELTILFTFFTWIASVVIYVASLELYYHEYFWQMVVSGLILLLIEWGISYWEGIKSLKESITHTYEAHEIISKYYDDYSESGFSK